MAVRCGRGVGEDGEAEWPPLVFAMAEMKGGGCSGFQRCLSLCAGETVKFLGFKGLYMNGVWGVFMFKIFQGNRKVVFRR